MATESPMPTTLKFPQDILCFFHWFLFKPNSLSHSIHNLDSTLEVSDPSLVTLWKHWQNERTLGSLVLSALIYVLVISSFFCALILQILTLVNIPFEWPVFALGMIFGITGGISIGITR